MVPNFWNCAKLVDQGSSHFGCKLIWTRPTAADMTVHGTWYIKVPAKIFIPHISVLYIFCEVKFKLNMIYVLVLAQRVFSSRGEFLVTEDIQIPS